MKKNENRIISYIFLAVVFVLFAGIVLRIFTRTVLVSRLKINNAFTSIVFFDAKGLLATETVTEVPVDWASLYPFNTVDSREMKVENVENPGIYSRLSSKVTGIVSSAKTKVNDFTTAYLPGYDSYVYLSNKYKNLIGWNFASYAEYNGILELEDGYLSSVTEKKNVNNAAAEVIDFAKKCESMNIPFVYVLAPEKLCSVEDAEYSETVDFANQNADDFLSIINANGVRSLDLRVRIHEEGLNHHSMFFRTDHHWIPEAGLWAAREIVKFMSDSYNLDADSSMLLEENFDATEYHEWFLGSQGKKVTLANTTADDINLLTPRFETELTVDIPSINYVNTGDFTVTYDMDQINVRDYNKKSPYHAYCFGDRALITIKNEMATNNTRIIIIRDSFGDVVAPFAALAAKETITIDLRYFTGSLVSFIEEQSPDAVVVLYGMNEIGEPEFDSHSSLWDLR